MNTEKYYGLFADCVLILICSTKKLAEEELEKRQANKEDDDTTFYQIKEVDVVSSDIESNVLYSIYKNHSPYLSFKEKDKAIDEIKKLQEKMLDDGAKLLAQLKSVDCTDALSINSYPTTADKLLLELHDLPRYSIRLISLRS